MSPKMICPKCGTQMNHHADKLDYTIALTKLNVVDPNLGGILEEVHTCPKPNCKNVEVRTAWAEVTWGDAPAVGCKGGL